MHETIFINLTRRFIKFFESRVMLSSQCKFYFFYIPSYLVCFISLPPYLSVFTAVLLIKIAPFCLDFEFRSHVKISFVNNHSFFILATLFC